MHHARILGAIAGKITKKVLTHRANQIAEFGEFYPVTNLEKNKIIEYYILVFSPAGPDIEPGRCTFLSIDPNIRITPQSFHVQLFLNYTRWLFGNHPANGKHY